MPSLANGSPNGRKNNTRRDGTRAIGVLPHGRLEVLADNLWSTWGALPRTSRRRSMTIARRSDGRLVLQNAIALDETGMRQLETIGKVAFIVTRPEHRFDARIYKERFPKVQVFVPRGSESTVGKVVEVEGIYEDVPPNEDVYVEALHGLADAAAMVVRSVDGVSLVLDGVFDPVADRARAASGYLASLLGSMPLLSPNSRVRVSRLRSALARFAKFSFVKNKRALREDLERYAADPELVRLVVTHANVVRGGDAARVLREAATLL